LIFQNFPDKASGNGRCGPAQLKVVLTAPTHARGEQLHSPIRCKINFNTTKLIVACADRA